MHNIHATCVALNNKGILLTGKSGAGKSDLALRLIEQVGAELVSDDITIISNKNNELYACSPDSIKGLIEVRGIGIINKKYIKETSIKLIVELVEDFKLIERLPEKEYEKKEGVTIRKIMIYPFETSSVYKIKVVCDEIE